MSEMGSNIKDDEPLETSPTDDSDLPAGITSSAVRGFAWQIASFGGNRLIIFISTLALARLLVPKDFGVFAAALTFTQYLEVLLDFGLGSYLIYDQDQGNPDQLHIAFTLNLIMTVGLTALTIAVSPFTSALFGAPHQTAVFAWMSVYLFLRGWSQVNQALIQRDLLFKKLVVIDLVGAAVRAGLSVGLALAGVGVYSIVVGFLVGQAISTITAYAVVRYRPRIRFDWTLGRKMVSFGVNSVAIDLLTELALNGDYLVIGSMIGSTALGIYSIAYRLPELLINNLFWLFSGVAFPIYSRSRLAGMEFLRRAMLKALKFTSIYGFAAGIGLALVSRDAILVLFGSQWRGAITPMVIVSLAAALASTTYASGPLFPALGKPGTLVLVNIPLTIGRMAGFIVAAPYGLVWVASVHLISNVVMVVIRFAIANRVVGTTARQTFRALLPALAVAAGVTALALPLRLLMHSGPAAFASIIVAGIVGSLGALLLVDRGIFGEIRHLGHALGHNT